MHRSTSLLLLAALLAASSAGCADAVTAAPPRAAGTVTVDASTGWAYVRLADSSTVIPLPSANESTSWDIALFATNVTLNGGAAGPGGVSGACVCQNAGATNAEILAMTAESERSDFDAITSVPVGATFTTDQLSPAIAGWHTGVGPGAIANPGVTYLVRLSDSLSFAKVHVTALEAPTATSAGRVTLEYALQRTSTSEFESTRTLTVDLTTAGAKSVDLNDGSLTASATAWDLRLEGFTIKVNGGVSGPGKTAAAVGTTAFASTTTAVVALQSYRSDTYAGVFGTNRFFRYNIGGDNRISPTFDVYLVRRGESVYALQVIGYYSKTAQARHITFRYKQLT